MFSTLLQPFVTPCPDAGGGKGTWSGGGGVDGGPDADHLPPAGRVHGVRRRAAALRPHLRLRAGRAGRVGGQGSRQRLGLLDAAMSLYWFSQSCIILSF